MESMQYLSDIRTKVICKIVTPPCVPEQLKQCSVGGVTGLEPRTCHGTQSKRHKACVGKVGKEIDVSGGGPCSFANSSDVSRCFLLGEHDGLRNVTNGRGFEFPYANALFPITDPN